MGLFLPKFEDFSAEIEGYFHQNRLFWQKELLSAEMASFGISEEMFLFEVPSFSYRQKEEISLSVAHYLCTRRVATSVHHTVFITFTRAKTGEKIRFRHSAM